MNRAITGIVKLRACLVVFALVALAVVLGGADSAVAANAKAKLVHTFSLASETLTVTITGDGASAGSVTSSPAGIDCGLTCSHDFDQGTSVTLTAIGTVHDNFEGWSGGGCPETVDSGDTCTLTMNSPTSVTADFQIHGAPAPCLVPNVKGKSLRDAKSAIKRHACGVGTIKRAFSKKVKKGHVISQNPKAHYGVGRPFLTKVNLIVSRGRHP